jgi:hypothetical protein
MRRSVLSRGPTVRGAPAGCGGPSGPSGVGGTAPRSWFEDCEAVGIEVIPTSTDTGGRDWRTQIWCPCRRDGSLILRPAADPATEQWPIGRHVEMPRPVDQRCRCIAPLSTPTGRTGRQICTVEIHTTPPKCHGLVLALLPGVISRGDLMPRWQSARASRAGSCSIWPARARLGREGRTLSRSRQQ